MNRIRRKSRGSREGGSVECKALQGLYYHVTPMNASGISSSLGARRIFGDFMFNEGVKGVQSSATPCLIRLSEHSPYDPLVNLACVSR